MGLVGFWKGRSLTMDTTRKCNFTGFKSLWTFSAQSKKGLVTTEQSIQEIKKVRLWYRKQNKFGWKHLKVFFRKQLEFRKNSNLFSPLNNDLIIKHTPLDCYVQEMEVDVNFPIYTIFCTPQTLTNPNHVSVKTTPEGACHHRGPRARPGGEGRQLLGLRPVRWPQHA